MRSKAASDQFISDTNDFRVKAGAYIIDVGIDIGGLTTDIFGTTYTAGSSDLGAAEYVVVSDTHTADGTLTLGAISVSSGVATRILTASGTVSVGALTVGGDAMRVVTGSGNVNLKAIDLAGTGHPTYSASGGVSLGAVTVVGGATRSVNASGNADLAAIAVGSGKVLAAPMDLFCNNSTPGAQSGETNPTGITDLTPAFSCNVTMLSAAITHVQIQVSAEEDSDFSESLSWDSGWLELTTPITAADTDGKMRIEDIIYGQGA
jgi:hypothetical protein